MSDLKDKIIRHYAEREEIQKKDILEKIQDPFEWRFEFMSGKYYFINFDRYDYDYISESYFTSLAENHKFNIHMTNRNVKYWFKN